MKLGFMNLMSTKNIFDDIDFAIKNNFNAFGIGLDWEQNWNLKPKTLKKIKEICESNNIHLDIHTAYFLATSAIHPDVRKTVINVLKSSIILANKVNSHSITVHPGYRESIDEEKNYEALKKTLIETVKFGKKYDVMVCLENHAAPFSPCFFMEDMLNVLKSVDGLKVTLDIGHANIDGNSVLEYYKKLKDCVVNVHIHDNDGTSDQHRCIGEGNIDFKKIFKQFKKNKYDGPFILEIFIKDKLIKCRDNFLKIWKKV